MGLTLRTVTGDTVVLEYKECSVSYEGGIAFGKFKNTEHCFPYGFWDRLGNAVYIRNFDGDLQVFQLASISEDDFEKIPMVDEEEGSV